MKSCRLSLAALSLVLLGAPASAQDKPGRYTMTPADGGGFIRLDTETGAVSTCRRRNDTWACEPIDDSNRANSEELSKLRAENKELKADIKRLEDFALDKKQEGAPPPQLPKIEIPSESDVDRALDEVERLFRKYRDRLRQFDGEAQSSPPVPAPPAAPAPAPAPGKQM